MDLETFLEELRATCKNFRWVVDECGNLRGTTSLFPHTRVCPIVAVGLEKGLISEPVFANFVGLQLGLADNLTCVILQAADNHGRGHLVAHWSLRRQLLDAVASSLTWTRVDSRGDLLS